MVDDGRELMKEMEKDIRAGMIIASNELFEIIEPINGGKIGNGGKPSYKDKMKFLDNKGFDKAWEKIKNIIQAHRWLVENVKPGESQ